jgi:GTP-binding protein
VFAISALDGTGCTALTYAVMDYLGTQSAVILEEDVPAAGSPVAESPAAD